MRYLLIALLLSGCHTSRQPIPKRDYNPSPIESAKRDIAKAERHIDRAISLHESGVAQPDRTTPLKWFAGILGLTLAAVFGVAVIGKKGGRSDDTGAD